MSSFEAFEVHINKDVEIRLPKVQTNTTVTKGTCESIVAFVEAVAKAVNADRIEIKTVRDGDDYDSTLVIAVPNKKGGNDGDKSEC